MKIGKDNNIKWMDDNHVDFSRKRRVRKDRLISKRYMKFSPEDMTIETDDWNGNPSINAKTYGLSDYFDDHVNDKHYLLNRGWSSKTETNLGSFFRRVRDGFEMDIDITDDDENIISGDHDE